MPNPLPGIDLSTCGEWTENDRDMYESYDFYLAKTEVERRKEWMTFKKLTKSKPWKPNHGNKLRGVRRNPSPHMRQQFTPVPLTSNPVADIMNVTETVDEAILYWHEFESPAFNFLPSFVDFLDHISETGTDIQEKVARSEELFYRTMMFHMSPGIYVAQGNTATFVPSPMFDGLTQLGANHGKSTAFLNDVINDQGGAATHLTLASLNKIHTHMSVSLGIPPISGSSLPEGDNKALNQKYALITGEEAWDQFMFDPYLQQHKNCDLDVIFSDFRGSLFNRITSKLEKYPIHLKNDGTMVAPEVRVDNGVAFNEGETVPNPVYANLGESADPTQESPWAVSWITGTIGYDALSSGPPPAAFTGNKPPHNFPAMKWNGEVYLTKDFLLECVDPVSGAIRTKTNSKGRYLRYESTMTYGIFPRQRRSIYPILHKRKQGV